MTIEEIFKLLELRKEELIKILEAENDEQRTC